MSVVDSFSGTDPPGYRIDLLDGGTVHITGKGMDQTLQAEGAKSAQQWYDQNAYAFLPLPPQVDSFVQAARAAGQALASAASAATPSLAEQSDVAEFATAVGEALSAAGQAMVPLGIGSDLIGLGATISMGAAYAQPEAEGVLSGTWNDLDQAIDFYTLAQNAQQDRGVNDDAKAQLQGFAAQASQVGASTKALLNL
jgi:hypothetical protein